jgi:molybdate transport system substrate-binding protein
MRPMKKLIFSCYLYLIITICGLFFSASIANSAEQRPAKPIQLRIAVAANFAPVLKQLLPEFEQEQQIEIQVITSASGVLFQQIVHGAPFDIFLSADSVRPALLEKRGFIISRSRKSYALGELALYSAANINFSVADLTTLSTSNKRFAIANPNTAPYGKAAQESLQYLGLWQKLQPRLITGMSINQTFQQVKSKAVYAGIVAYSQLKLNNLKGSLLPKQSYHAISQQLVILKSTKHPELAAKFVQFLLSAKSQQYIANLGYQPVDINTKAQVTHVNRP